MSDIRLDPLNTPAGLMERLFLHETRSPGYGAKYNRDESLKAMRLMRQAIQNRLTEPKLWGARGAKDEIGIITVRSQFGQFADYPKLSDAFMTQVTLIVSLANSPKDPRSAANAQHVSDAITAATEASPPGDLMGLGVVGWRTAGHGSPGSNFVAVMTAQGNTFYALKKH